jgi:multidrug efflux pump subunit AcrB
MHVSLAGMDAQSIQATPGSEDVSSDLQMSAPPVNVDIRRDLAMSLDVDPEMIANTLYDAYGIRRANTIMVASQRYDVVMEVAPGISTIPDAPGDSYIYKVKYGSATGRPQNSEFH